MRPEIWPDWIDDLWAKSAAKGEGGQPETLAQHTWLVLSRLTDFVTLRASLPGQLGQPRLWHCLYWGTFLHDFGKAMPGFQGVLRKDKALKDRWGGHRHEVFSLAFLDWIAEGLNAQERLWAAAAIVSHHRDADDLLYSSYPTPEPGDDDPLESQFVGLALTHIQGLHRWLTDCSWAWARSLGLDRLGVDPVQFVVEPEPEFNSLAVKRIRKHLAVFGKFIRQLNRETQAQGLIPLLTLRGTLINADHSASGHFESLPKVDFRSADVLEKQGISRDQLYNPQREAETISGSALLTAPTGSGKTEAALLWGAGQARTAQASPRLFYTLPYQASMNAMQLRLQKIFGDDRVGLQHGRSLLTLYRQLMDRDYEPEQAVKIARQMRDLNRLNYPPVRVFSPYQMLKGMYRLKGYEAQLTDYHNALFIFDEIHAYETKRLALILKTIEYLRNYYHARFFIMSATFPTLIKHWLQEALGETAEITAGPDLFEQFQRHRLEVIQGEMFTPENFARIVADARGGKSVLVVCNLVDRAQQAYNGLKHLRDEGIPVELLHGRFNLRDRLRKERFVRDATGSTSGQRRAIILVATQVVEVSLDIDLNTIYTEPAPLEALVQRFGRVNRRRKMHSLAPVHVFALPDDGQKIYDHRLVTNTLKVLNRQDGQPVDESKVGDWLDEIYAGEVADAWKADFDKAARDFERFVIGTLRPFDSDETLKEEFYKAFDGIDVLPQVVFDEYLTLLDEEPIRARELLVSISWGRYHSLAKAGRVLPHDDRIPPVVLAAYDEEIGLTFDEYQEGWDV
jgi:CRISPR-associated endonuclease/helicase Cas3